MKNCKNIAIYIVTFALCLFLPGCSADDQSILKLSANAVAFEADGGEAAVEIYTDDGSWGYAMTPVEWCTVRSDDKSLIISTGEYNGTDVLKMTIEVWSGNTRSSIFVTQTGPEGYQFSLLPEETDFTFDYRGGKFTVSMQGDAEWRAEVVSAGEWLDYQKNEKSGLFIVEAGCGSEDSNTNTASVNIYIGETSSPFKTYNLTQKPNSRDRYYGLIGTWELYCDEWMYIDSNKGTVDWEIGPGAMTFCTIEEDVVDQTLKMVNLFNETGVSAVGFIAPITYLPDGNIKWDLSNPVQTAFFEGYAYVSYYSFFHLLSGEFPTPVIKGEVSEDVDEIRLFSFPEFYGGDNAELCFGLVMDMGGTMQYFSGIHYAWGTDLKLRKIDPSSAGANSFRPENTHGGQPMDDNYQIFLRNQINIPGR